MTRLLISTAIAGLLGLTVPVLAQGQDDHRQDRGRREQNAAPAQPAPREAERPQIGGRFGRGFNPGPAAQNAPNPPSPPSPPQNDQRREFGGNFPRGQAAQNNAAPPDRQGEDRRAREDRRPGAGMENAPAAQPAPRAEMRGQGPNNAMRGPDTAMRAPDNAMRGPDRAFRGPNNGMREPRAAGRDFSFFRRNFEAQRRFRAAGYRRPRGWYPHHWSYGEFLPSLFWTPDYWLDDYMDFGLEPPPPGTVWVRDGDDALLIDRFSGEIIQVAYNVFY